MIVSNFPQGSPEWIAARLGVASASNFHRIVNDSGNLRMARAGDGLAQGAETYLNELLAEWMIQQPVNTDANAYMQRGTMMEDEGAAWYEFTNDCTTERIGFCTTQCGRVGASPDRTVGEHGLLEIKVPGIVAHVANMREMTTDHDAQCFGQLYVTGRDWVDLVSFNPTLAPAVRRIERDETYITNLHNALFDDGGFVARLEAAKAKLVADGFNPAVLCREERGD